MTQPPPFAPGWHPDGTGSLRYHDGYQWTSYTDGPPRQNNNSRGAFLAVVAGLVIIGAILNLSSVSLLTGTDKVWIGVGLIALALLFCFVPRRLPAWAIAVTAIVLALAVANGIYDEVQLQDKRDQLEQVIP